MWILLCILVMGCGSPPSGHAERDAEGGGTEKRGAEAPGDPGHEGHDHGEHAHDPAEHGHGASHGGQQVEVNGNHAEALFQADGVHFYLTDGDNKPIDPSGVFGSARVTGPNGVENVSLMAMGASLHAPVRLVSGQPASAVLTYTVNGSQVGMWGNYHVELLMAEGRYRVWVTDAARGPVAGAVMGAVIDGASRCVLEPDAATGALQCAASDAGKRPVAVELNIDGQPLSLPFAEASPSPSTTP